VLLLAAGEEILVAMLALFGIGADVRDVRSLDFHLDPLFGSTEPLLTAASEGAVGAGSDGAIAEGAVVADVLVTATGLDVRVAS
jgi:hypothetical protein